MSWTNRAPVIDSIAARTADRPKAPLDTTREAIQAVGVGRHRTDLDALPALIEQAEIQPPAAEIQTSVQHMSGPPSGSLLG